MLQEEFDLLSEERSCGIPTVKKGRIYRVRLNAMPADTSDFQFLHLSFVGSSFKESNVIRSDGE